jgi:hypothetical protein
MRLLADENFLGAAVDALRDVGHGFVWVRTAARGASDRAPHRAGLAHDEVTPADPDAQVLLEPAPGGTRVTANHTNVPTATRATRRRPAEHYFETMKVYFARGE